jgi:hypothetical protein
MTGTNIKHVISVLETAERTGAAEDKPEGSRTVILSDTLAKHLAKVLRKTADEFSAMKLRETLQTPKGPVAR